MKITQAMYLAHDMIMRAKAGNAGVAILGSAGAPPFYRPNLSNLKNSMEGVKRRIPHEHQYRGAVAALKTNSKEPGVGEMLNELYEEYPELQK
ncbi:MAG: hypothetical protein V1887_01690 [Candidatus Aenigmatarchaeota archaeon]